MAKHNRLSTEKVQHAIRRHAEGATLRTIAGELNITESGVSKALKRAGKPARRMNAEEWKAKERAIIRDAYREQVSNRELARRHGVSPAKVTTLLPGRTTRLRNERLQRARALLADGATLNDVAAALGFKDRGTVSKLLAWGMSRP